MSTLRDFAYVFIVSDKAESFGLLTKVLIPVLLTLSLSLPYIFPGVKISAVQTLVALLYEVAIAVYLAGFRRFVGMLRFIGLFILLGFTLNIVSVFMGAEPFDPIYIALATLRVVAVVLAITLLFQMLSISEIRYLLLKLKLKYYSEVFAVAMAQLPSTFISFSEAYIAAKLKLGGRSIASLIKPLVVESILNSRYVAEALYMHGLPPVARPRLLSPLDPVLLVPAVVVSLLHLMVT
ncbi:MAG: hypothetical protein RMI56_03600 [Sulfolobales archaeon]|nr:hypothetical protein [Sulfolobales archaeon]MDW8082866.1 hypothetical protein [Sulfolobales archaeon]